MKTKAFFLSLLCCASAAAQQTLTPEVLRQLEGQQEATAAERALRNAVQSNSINKMALATGNQQAEDTWFSVEVNGSGITNQESSGRCWLFTGTNVLRRRAMKNLGVEGFMFSHVHLFFYDQLEKANLFLQSIIDTRRQDINSQQVQWLMKNPISDGGTYTGVADLVTKYGLVPKDVMAETYVSNSTSEFNGHLKRKLREIAINLREKSEAGQSVKQLEAYKVEQMKTIYRMLTLAYGQPVKEFTWAPRDKKGKLLSEPKRYTPLSFYKEVCQPEEDLNADYVMLMNDPSRPYNKVYEIDMDRHTYEGHNWLYVNLDIDQLSAMAIRSLQDSMPMYFSCDVGKQLNRQNGLLDVNNYDYDDLFGTHFGMTKRQRIQTLDSGSSHAMTLVAVDLDAEGKPTKWKVENSWGPTYGFSGHLIMTHEWFSEYMFRVVVNKKYCTPEVLEILKQKPTRLPAWDPMFLTMDN
ncbi:MAG: C1 family peptidase [Bacteroidaceae bacterium]|nr:C1 family peptidase [Bacteroidaceae bacterium]